MKVGVSGNNDIKQFRPTPIGYLFSSEFMNSMAEAGAGHLLVLFVFCYCSEKVRKLLIMIMVIGNGALCTVTDHQCPIVFRDPSNGFDCVGTGRAYKRLCVLIMSIENVSKREIKGYNPPLIVSVCQACCLLFTLISEQI